MESTPESTTDGKGRAPGEILAGIVERAHQRDPDADQATIQALFGECRAMVDEVAEPLKWAAVHAQFAPLLRPADEAIAAYQVAIAAFRTVEDMADAVGSLALDLVGLLTLVTADDIELAVDLLELAVPTFPETRRLLAELYTRRIGGDRLSNWQRRIDLLEAAVADTDPVQDASRWATLNNDWAEALTDEPDGNFIAAGARRLEAHQRSLDALDAATDSIRSIRVQTHVKLGEAYLALVPPDATPRANAIEQARRMAEQAVELCTDDVDGDTRRTALQFLARVVLEGDPTDRELLRSLDLLRDGERLLDPETQPNSTANVLKGQLLVMQRWLERTTEPAARQQVCSDITETAERALGLLDVTGNHDQYWVWLILGECLVADRVAEAEAAFGSALAVARLLLASSTSRAGRLEAIRWLAKPSGGVAHCRLVSGDLDGAIEALEAGRSQLWAPSADQAVAAEAAAPLPRPAALVPDGGALLMICCAFEPGWAIICTARESHAVRLDDFGAKRLLELTLGENDTETLGGWMLAYETQHTDSERFRNAIWDVGRVLGESFWAPIMAALDDLGIDDGAELLLFHYDTTPALPMHAAWRGDPNAPDWVIDHYALASVPSLRRLDASRASSPSGSGRPSVGLIVDPNDDLSHDQIERYALERVAPDLHVVAGHNATFDAVIDLFRANDWVHVAAHAAHDQTNVWNSWIALADRQRLTLESLTEALRSAARQPAIVVLAACEAATARVTSHANEALGFPNAMVEAGVGSVLAPMWGVGDASAALLAVSLYAELAAGHGPAQSLRSAQRWLRTASVDELLAVVGEVKQRHGRVAALRREGLHGVPRDTAIFAHPWHWAAFVATR